MHELLDTGIFKKIKQGPQALYRKRVNNQAFVIITNLYQAKIKAVGMAVAVKLKIKGYPGLFAKFFYPMGKLVFIFN